MDGQPSKQNSGSNQPDTNGNKNTRSDTSSKSSTSEREGRNTSTSGKQVKPVSEINLVKQPKVISVDVPNAEKEEEAPKKNPRGAGRKKGSVVKKTATKKNTQVMGKEDIKNIILTISMITSSREGMEVWGLTANEADQLAEPLANILSRNEAFSKVAGGNADAMALVLAAFMIFVPKFMQWNATRPKKRKKGESINYGNGTEHIGNGKSTVKQAGTNGATSKPSIGQPVEQRKQSNDIPSHQATQFGGKIGGLIDPLGGF